MSIALKDPKRYKRIAPQLPEGEIELASLLPGDGPLELVIGFGRGRFVLERAAEMPGSRILGVEIKAKLSYRVSERIAREKIENARVFWGDANDLLSRGGPPGSLRRVFVCFPDPWWKKRHTKRRLIGEAFLDRLARLIEVGGELFVQTDVDDRAEGFVALMAKHPAFSLRGEGGYIEASPFAARSNREVRAEEDGLPVHRILALRKDCPDTAGGAQLPT